MSTWYYSDAQRNRLGPVGTDDLAQLHAHGQLAPEVLVWREGMPEWKPWREVMAEVIGAGAAAAGVAPPAPARATFAVQDDGGGRNPYEVVGRVAAPTSPYAAPTATLSSHGAVVHEGEVVYAGFWKRYAAYCIDGLIVGIAGFMIQMMVAGVVFGGMAAISSNPSEAFGSVGGVIGMLVMYLAPIGLAAVYFGFFHASANQATLGKMAVGIKVTANDGSHISFWRGFGRYFGFMLSAFTFGIGYIMAGFTERKRALHDMISSTLVVDKWAFTAHPERQRRELGAVTIVIMVLSLLGVVAYVALIGVFIAAMGAGMAAH